jgi:hypothetical protein
MATALPPDFERPVFESPELGRLSASIALPAARPACNLAAGRLLGVLFFDAALVTRFFFI